MSYRDTLSTGSKPIGGSMAKKKTQEQEEQDQRLRDVQETAEPSEGLEDESQDRNRQVDEEQFDASSQPAPGSDEDPARGKQDESQERNEEVDEQMAAESEDLGLRSEKDGGYADEDLPVVRAGEVYEDVRPAHDDHRRYVKVLLGPEDTEDGKVLVQNEETYRRSRIDRRRFSPEHGWARFAS